MNHERVYPLMNDFQGLPPRGTDTLALSPGSTQKSGKGPGVTCKYSRMCCVGHMEKQETEIKRKLEMETGNGNWKLKTEMETQLFHCCSPSKI